MLGLSPVVSAQMIVVGGTKIGDYKCFLICEAANKLKPVSSLGFSFYGGLKHPCKAITILVTLSLIAHFDSILQYILYIYTNIPVTVATLLFLPHINVFFSE